MNRRGRPALTGRLVEIHIHLRLRAGEDDDLLAFFEQLPAGRRTVALKTALRAGGMQADEVENGSSDDSLAEALEGLTPEQEEWVEEHAPRHGIAYWSGDLESEGIAARHTMHEFLGVPVFRCHTLKVATRVPDVQWDRPPRHNAAAAATGAMEAVCVAGPTGSFFRKGLSSHTGEVRM